MEKHEEFELPEIKLITTQKMVLDKKGRRLLLVTADYIRGIRANSKSKGTSFCCEHAIDWIDCLLKDLDAKGAFGEED